MKLSDRLIAALFFILLLGPEPVAAQNPTCPTRPSGDSTNACASTAFVANAIVFTGGAPGKVLQYNASAPLESFQYGAGGININSGSFGTNGGGVADNCTAFAAINTAVLASPNGTTTVWLEPGLYSLDCNITLQGEWHFTRSAILKPANGKVITFNRPIVTSPTQIFYLYNTSTGTSFGGRIAWTVESAQQAIHAEWFGAIGDNATKYNNVAIQQAVSSLYNTGLGITFGGVVNIGTGTFKVNNTINIQNTVVINGLGSRSTAIVADASAWGGGESIFQFVNGTSACFGARLNELSISVSAIVAITKVIDGSCWNEYAAGVTNLNISGFLTYGIYNDAFYGGSSGFRIANVEFFNDATATVSQAIRLLSPSISGWSNIAIENVTITTANGTDALTNRGITAFGRLNLNILGLGIEGLNKGIVLNDQASLYGNGLRGGGQQPNSTNLIVVGTETNPNFANGSTACPSTTTTQADSICKNYPLGTVLYQPGASLLGIAHISRINVSGVRKGNQAAPVLLDQVQTLTIYNEDAINSADATGTRLKWQEPLLYPVPVEEVTLAGDFQYFNGSYVARLVGNSSGTLNVLTETSSVPSFQPLASIAVTSITGTANQITASASTGPITLSLAGPHNFTTLTGLALGSGTGAISAYGGTSCTNQFVRSLNASGVATCNSVSLTADVTGDLPFANLVQGATNTVVANATSGTADFAAFAMPSCSTSGSALKWTTNTGFGCNTSIDAATLGSATFASPGAIGGGTPGAGTFTNITFTGTMQRTCNTLNFDICNSVNGNYIARFWNMDATNPYVMELRVTKAASANDYLLVGTANAVTVLGITTDGAIANAGGIAAGAPTGGVKGNGTINISGAYYANNTIGVTCAAGFSAVTGRSVLGIVTAC